MHNLYRWFNQNRLQVIIGATLVTFIFIILRLLNGYVKVEQEQKQNELNLRNSSTSTRQSTTTSRANESVITGVKISEQTTNSNKTIIKKFVDYCNDVKVEEAYNMLTDECKEVMYPTLKDFVSNYFLKIFDIVRIYSLENWYSENDSFTYYVKYTEDVLATGNAKSADSKSDYITIVYTDTGAKLNIGSYIGRTINNEVAGNESISISTNWTDVYMDYCVLNVSLRNNTQKTVCFDTKESSESVFLYDENNVKYNSFLNELSDDELIVGSGKTNTLNIKFNKIYNPSRVVKGVYFSNIVLNYENYEAKIERKERLVLNT